MKDVSAMENGKRDWNHPRWCGACKKIHREHQTDCDPSCTCDRVDCAECGPRIARRIWKDKETLSAPVQPGPRPQPTCPKCGSDGIVQVWRSGNNKAGFFVSCHGCHTEIPTYSVSDFAAFFPVAAPSAPEVDEKRARDIIAE